jgi:transcriptional regulator with XRE-family HTH domain
MALSQQKPTIAVLRSVVGAAHGQEARFAKTLGISVSLLKKLCSGNRALSRDLAVKIETETGISAEWLLAGKTNKPPVTPQGDPYSKGIFEMFRIVRKFKGGAIRAQAQIADLFARLLTIAQQASMQGQLPYFLHKFGELEKDIETLCGPSPAPKTRERIKRLLEVPWPNVDLTNSHAVNPKFFIPLGDLLVRQMREQKDNPQFLEEARAKIDDLNPLLELSRARIETNKTLVAEIGQRFTKNPAPPKTSKSSRAARMASPRKS